MAVSSGNREDPFEKTYAQLERLIEVMARIHVELHALRKVLSSGLENLALVSSHVT